MKLEYRRIHRDESKQTWKDQIPRYLLFDGWPNFGGSHARGNTRIGEPIKINRIEEFALVAAKGKEARHAFGRYTGILFSR
jgi:hypothetical protein